MGRPYEYGGTGEDGGGFDCSGLIQYAYGRHGVTLPRRSVDQAREGTAIGKSYEALRPGDVLTFSNRGGPVTHVGLYIGEGKFIHSATRGVQVSVLSGDDPVRPVVVRPVGGGAADRRAEAGGDASRVATETSSEGGMLEACPLRFAGVERDHRASYWCAPCSP